MNLVLWGEGSSGAVPFSTLVALLALWFCVSVPLTFVGAYFGFRKRVSFVRCFWIQFKSHHVMKSKPSMRSVRKKEVMTSHDDIIVFCLFVCSFIFLDGKSDNKSFFVLHSYAFHQNQIAKFEVKFLTQVQVKCNQFNFSLLQCEVDSIICRFISNLSY